MSCIRFILLTSVVGEVVSEVVMMVDAGGGLLWTVISDAVNCVEVKMVVDVVSIDVSVDKDVDCAEVAEEFCVVVECEAEEEELCCVLLEVTTVTTADVV